MPNMMDGTVLRVIREPWREHGRWWVEVEFTSYGVVETKSLMFNSKEKASNVKAGRVFQFWG